MLEKKRILLGISGGIAAYKAAILVRTLIKRGAEVRVVMTPTARQFIAPLTLATLSRHPILVDFFNPENGAWNSHVDLGLWADAYVIAPATANTLGKMANGIADNLLVTAYLSAKCPVFVAPAMDLDMYRHPSTVRNLACLAADGVHIVEPGSGFLASGLEGKGRMSEPDEIADALTAFFQTMSCPKRLAGKKVVVSAGGTIEPIDAVRYISNYSSGKMGYALAGAFLRAGAEVTVVRASVDAALIGSIPGVREVKALSAADMLAAMRSNQPDADILVMAAAVADYTPEETSDRKIKKKAGEPQLVLRLKETADVAAELGRHKRPGQLLVGFALETDDEERHALEKLRRKRLDCIVLNSLRDQGAGFGYATNKITIIDKAGDIHRFGLKEKSEAAEDIVEQVCAMLEGLERNEPAEL